MMKKIFHRQACKRSSHYLLLTTHLQVRLKINIFFMSQGCVNKNRVFVKVYETYFDCVV
jgi:hypothetical protein